MAPIRKAQFQGLFVERDGRIYGRGACDMKAGIAVILDAAEICIQERQFLRGKIMIVLVCDEETYSYVRFLLEDEL